MRNINRSKQRKDERRQTAEERQADRDKRGDEKQLKRLDAMLGKGQGAERERGRLEARLDAKQKSQSVK